jgi:hypothetical protein
MKTTFIQKSIVQAKKHAKWQNQQDVRSNWEIRRDAGNKLAFEKKKQEHEAMRILESERQDTFEEEMFPVWNAQLMTLMTRRDELYTSLYSEYLD